jgi:hypothetical protein
MTNLPLGAKKKFLGAMLKKRKEENGSLTKSKPIDQAQEAQIDVQGPIAQAQSNWAPATSKSHQFQNS